MVEKEAEEICQVGKSETQNRNGTWWTVADFEDARKKATSHGMQVVFLEAGKGRSADSPLELPEGASLADSLILAQWAPCQASDLQNNVLF